MKGFIRKLLWTLALIAALIVVVAVALVAFLKFSPRTGKDPDTARTELLAKSPNYRDGRFVNRVATSLSTGEGNMLGAAYDWLFGGKNRVPPAALPTGYEMERLLSSDTTDLAVTWFGHSAVMLRIDGKTLLLDPMFGEYSSPLPLFGKRFAADKQIPIDSLPPIDAVLISHDHYDHLDQGSIAAIRERTGHFYVPLGVGSHLRYWGVPDDMITELDWWDEVTFHGLTLTAAPARHFSGRAVPEGNPTLWCSWVIASDSVRVFFSGDGGYSPTFKEIGERLGPFDFTMLECGQYNERWAEIHMMPEQTAQAQVDLRGEVMMPIHWGAFNLALHEWDDPPKRLTAAAEQLGVRVASPLIGETFGLDSIPTDRWWSKIK